MPVVLLNGYNVVKSIQFGVFRTLGNPITVSQIYDARGVDELIFLDIRATSEGRPPHLDIVSEITSQCFMPLTVGGGVKSVQDAAELLRCGADKVSINTAAVQNPHLITELSRRFGAQCVVVSIDCKKSVDGNYVVYTHAGKQATSLNPSAWAQEAERLGAGEILLNSIDHDGKMDGYDLELILSVASSVTVPVIACGGAGKPADFADAITQGKAAAVAAASIYHFTSTTPLSVKQYLHQQGIPVRLES